MKWTTGERAKKTDRHKNRIKRSGQARLVYVKTHTAISPPREGEPARTDEAESTGKSRTGLYEMLYWIRKVTNWIIWDALSNRESHQLNYKRCFIESGKSPTELYEMLCWIRKVTDWIMSDVGLYQTFYSIRKGTHRIISDVLLNKKSHKLDYIRRFIE